MFTLFIYVGRHLDSWGQWFWTLFGEELYIAPGKAQWHARVGLAMGGTGLLFDVLSMRRIYATRHRRRAMQAQLEAEIAERLAEQRQQAGLPPTGEPDTETRLREQIRRWPALHDLLWGWPMLLALLMPWLTDPVSALTGIFLGAIAYAINHHYLSKREGRLGLRIALAAAVGLLAVGIWFKFVPAMTGAPVPDARKSTVAPAAASSGKVSRTPCGAFHRGTAPGERIRRQEFVG